MKAPTLEEAKHPQIMTITKALPSILWARKLLVSHSILVWDEI